MSVRACVLAVAAFGLVGCEDVSGAVTDGLSRIGAPSDATAQGIRTLSLMQGDVLVRGPEGYCVDQAASNARRGFAVMAGCALMSEDAAIMPSLDGLITVQVGADETSSVAGNEEAFAAFLETEAGRGLLAADSDTASVGEVTTIAGDGRVLARFEDASGPVFQGTTGPQWRGFLDVKGRLVTITVLSFERNELSRSEGERLMGAALEEFVEVNTSADTPKENG
ncbi:hypothetical protein L0666_12580 [Octadecabacter sp. CECT 8868]|uniref:hypothetical protein n=1 Tax=Octadecabacter algicola TaxID=2909342 RepID=UPI001F39CFC6|nr:hypothetical protein [Octadecabacter algicola]MCF2905826.1 hypothetical protein [Octadecabacter algicola]